ncbi:MAG: nonstructural protein [Microvirus sp.]|nr:MAG: nonstructural protein [Microvirus sp.]
MVLIVVSVYDRASDAFGRPLFVAAVGQAIRSFQDEINRDEPNNAMAAHSDDFDLFQLGTFDDSTGSLVACEPKQLAIGKQLRVYASKA